VSVTIPSAGDETIPGSEWESASGQLSRIRETDRGEARQSQPLILKGADQALLHREAMRLAAVLNCGEAEPSRRPCGVCIPCRQIGAGSFPHLIILSPFGPANQIQIGQIRDLQRRLMSKAAEGQYKVAVLTDADRMNEVSQNCLLKTLEEPPDHTRILLLTGKPEELLPTVRSRCRMLAIRDEAAVPSAADRDLVLDVLSAIEDFGYGAVFEKAAFVVGSRKKKFPDFFGALEYLLRGSMIDGLCHPAGPGGDDGVRFATGANLPEALRRVWRAGYLYERNVNALLILEDLFLAFMRLGVRAPREAKL